MSVLPALPALSVLPVRRTALPRTRRRAVLAIAAAAGLVVCSAGGATAHVRVFPDTTTAGGFAQLTFRVPTESDTAGTVGLRVDLPTDTPFTSVRTKPLAGWTAVVERGPLPEPVENDGATITEAATAVVWTADAGIAVGPGQYQEFALSVGPLPDAGTEVMLPATQTYSDGEVVEWADAPLADGSEPELPAPVLVTTEASAGDAHGAAGHDAEADPAAADTASASGDGTDGTEGTEGSGGTDATSDAAAQPAQDAGARWLGGGGLALGAAALVTAVVRRPRATREQ